MTIRVIGAGFGRTGTSTLKWALERLLAGRCHHMREVFAHPEQIRSWAALARGESVDLEQLLDGYVATCDWPSAAFYEALAQRFPDAKVVLTVRDFDKWYESATETIYAMATTVTRPPVEWLVRSNPRMREFPQMVDDVVWSGVFDGRFSDREHARAVFEAHIEDVKRKIPAERLLIYSPSQGWDPLCSFLDLPVPSEPMARENEREKMIAMRRRMTVVAWALSPITAPISLGLRALGR
jgi:hypothetical protein